MNNNMKFNCPLHKNAVFVFQCRFFFLPEISLQRPFVLALGVSVTLMTYLALHTSWNTVSHSCRCFAITVFNNALFSVIMFNSNVSLYFPVVFMGSEKYPSENGFDAFLKKHGGSDNASTDCERTIFQFDVQRKRFKEALDRWSSSKRCDLITSPLILMASWSFLCLFF